MDEVIYKKKDSIITFIIVFVVGLIVGFVAFFLIFNVFNKSKTTKEETSEKEEVNSETVEQKGKWTSISVDNTKFIDLHGDLEDYTYYNNRENGYESFSDIELGFMGFDKLTKEDFKITSDTDTDGRYYYNFSGDIITNTLKNIFNKDVEIDGSKLVGTTYTIKDSSIEFGSEFSVVEYDNSTNNYKVIFSGEKQEDYVSENIIKKKIVSAQEKNDEIKVISKAIYIYTAKSGDVTYFSIYSDPNNFKLLDNLAVNGYNATVTIDDYLDNASIITEYYKKSSNSNNYYFVSSVIK